MVKAKVVSELTGLLIAIVSGLVLLYLFPSFFKQSAAPILEKTLSTLGWGLVFLILAPVVMILLLVTVLGMPVAFLLLLAYVAALLLSVTVAAFALGKKLHERSKIKWLKSAYVQLAAGLFIIHAVAFLPLVGGLVKFAVCLLGLGAIFVTIKQNLKK